MVVPAKSYCWRHTRAYKHNTPTATARELKTTNAFFPTARLHEAVGSRRIAGLTERFIGVYNAYSQRRTLERDAPEALRRLREDGADVAVMVPV